MRLGDVVMVCRTGFRSFVGLDMVDSELVFRYIALLPRAGDYMSKLVTLDPHHNASGKPKSARKSFS